MPPSFAYLAISPNTAQDQTWYTRQNFPPLQYIKIGHTTDGGSGRANAYYTHNPSVYTRMMRFNNPLDDNTKATELQNRGKPPVAVNSSSALFLQRYCLQNRYVQGATANEWFMVQDERDPIVALIMKLDEDADAADVPKAFENEGEFCLLFEKIMGRGDT